MRNNDSTIWSWQFLRVSPGIVPCLIAVLLASRGVLAAGEIFDMDAIRDPKTLEVEVLQDWHAAEGQIVTRQKLVTINVGDMWPGQDYRVPVRMIVPADRKAKGFHLTGGSTPTRLKQDTKPNALERELLIGGIGLITPPSLSIPLENATRRHSSNSYSRT